MKSHVLSSDAVHPPLGRCKMTKDRERVVAHGLFQIRVEEASPDLDPGPVMLIRMSLGVARAGIMPMWMLSIPVQSTLGSEAAAPKNPVVMRHQTAFDRDSGGCRPHAGEHASLVFGEGVEERSNEHIARDTPSASRPDRLCV